MCILAVVAKFDDPPLSKAREQLCRGNAAGLFLRQLRRGGLLVR